MATVSTYLNFNRNTEEAFNFYNSVFVGALSIGIIDKCGINWMFNYIAH